MRTIPRTHHEQLDFFTSRLARWSADPKALGLSSEQIAALAVLLEQAREAHQSAREARAAAQSATLVQNSAFAALRQFGSGLVSGVRAHAAMTDSIEPLIAAQIPPVRPASPLGPPPTPRAVRARMHNDGSITLSWRGSRLGGTAYTIERQVQPLNGQPQPWVLLTSTVASRIIDRDVPRGLASVTYSVRAQRAGGTSGLSQIARVCFGVLPDGSAAHDTQPARARARALASDKVA